MRVLNSNYFTVGFVPKPYVSAKFGNSINKLLRPLSVDLICLEP